MNPDSFWTGLLAGAGLMLLAVLTYANKSDVDDYRPRANATVGECTKDGFFWVPCR